MLLATASCRAARTEQFRRTACDEHAEQMSPATPLKPVKGQTFRSKVSGRTVVKLDLAPASFKSKGADCSQSPDFSGIFCSRLFCNYRKRRNSEPCTGMPRQAHSMIRQTLTQDCGPWTQDCGRARPHAEAHSIKSTDLGPMSLDSSWASTTATAGVAM